MARDMEGQAAAAPAGRDGADRGDSGDSAAGLNAHLQQHHARLLDAAASVDRHLQQMLSCKQELAEQMDLLRRDGLHVLEQQKRLFEEEERLRAQADSLAAERTSWDAQRAARAEEQRAATAALESVRREVEGQRAELEQHRTRIEAELRGIAEREQAILERERRVQDDQAALASRCEALAAERQEIEDRARDVQRMQAEVDAGRASLEAEEQAVADARAQGEAQLKARGDALQRRESELAEALLLLGRESQRLQERRLELATGGGVPEDLQETCATLTAEKARLEGLLCESETSKRELEAHAAALAAQIEQLAADQTAADARAVEALATAASSQAPSAELDTETAALAAQLAGAEARAMELAARVAELETRNRVLVEENAALASTSAKLAQQVDSLTAEKTDGQATLTHLPVERDASPQPRDDERSAPPPNERDAQWDALAMEPHPDGTVFPADALTLEDEHAELVDQGKWVEAQVASLEHPCAEPGAPLETAEPAGVEQPDLVVSTEEHNAQPETDIRTLQTEVDDARAERNAGVAVQGEEREQPAKSEQTGEFSKTLELGIPQRPARFSLALFVLVVLGTTFAGVYGLVSPEFRSDAVVQLVPPGELKPAEVPRWLARQVSGVGTDAELLHDAWKRMHDAGYSRYDSKRDWLAALPDEMEVELDTASRRMTVRMIGDDPEGLCLAANSVAAAYAIKVARLGGQSPQPEQTATSMLAVPATPEAITVTDHRFSLAAALAAAVLFTGLLTVKLLRRAIMRDLRAIDDMVDPRESISNAVPAKQGNE